MNPFLTEIFPFAQSASQRTGIDPRIIAAQAALETGYGKHAPGNNYFGIKSHGMPGGATLATTEVINGQPVRTKSSFRQYPGMAESAEGYADFMLSNPRYGPLMKAQGLDAQLDALQASGYATDPNYSNKLRGIIGKMDPVNARINQGFSLFDDDIDRTVNNIGPVAQPRAGMSIPGITMGSSQAEGPSGFRGFLTNNRATLMGLAADLLARGADARRPIAGSGMMAGTLADERRGERRAKREEATQQRNMTADYIARTRPDLAEAVQAGVLSPGDAYKMAMQSGPKPEYREVGGKLYQMQDGQASLVPGIDYGSETDLFGGIPEEQFKGESGLRKEYTPLLKPLRAAAQGYDKVRKAAGGNTAADDLALIFGYMKTLDPTSTVREGEFANAQNAGGVGDQIINIYNNVRTGQRLTPTQRANFVESAGRQYGAYQEQWGRLNEQYGQLADQYGFDRSRIIAPVKTFEPYEAPQTAPPQMNAADIAESQKNAITAIQQGKDPAFVIQKLNDAGVPVPVELEQSIMYRGN